MAYIKKAYLRKKQYQKVSFDFKLSVIDEFIMDFISINHAAKVYNISRSSITYCTKKEKPTKQSDIFSVPIKIG